MRIKRIVSISLRRISISLEQINLEPLRAIQSIFSRITQRYSNTQRLLLSWIITCSLPIISIAMTPDHTKLPITHQRPITHSLTRSLSKAADSTPHSKHTLPTEPKVQRPRVPIHHPLTFHTFIQDIRRDAHAAGVSKHTLDHYLSHLKAPPPLKKHLLYRQHHQAERIWTFHEYLHHTLTHQLICQGRSHYKKDNALLARISHRYGVQAKFLVAIWGMESHFGANMGHDPLIQSLAILAYHHHRSSFYRRQLLDALKILDQPHVHPQELISAWDGGMGQIQFEPSAYLDYAVDFDHDGFKNIWEAHPDILASIANYLKENGWQPHQDWGVIVHLPNTLLNHHIRLKKAHALADWERWGVRQAHGQSLLIGHHPNTLATLIRIDDMPANAFLVFPNYSVLMRWNHSQDEMLTVGLFANALIKQRDPCLPSHSSLK